MLLILFIEISPAPYKIIVLFMEPLVLDQAYALCYKLTSVIPLHFSHQAPQTNLFVVPVPGIWVNMFTLKTKRVCTRLDFNLDVDGTVAMAGRWIDLECDW